VTLFFFLCLFFFILSYNVFRGGDKVTVSYVNGAEGSTWTR
jgi:hypothetical protein